MDKDSIIAWCSYCKSPIYSTEAFVTTADCNVYHIEETEEHDNCYAMIHGETE